jgi:hypothetical protein
MIQMTLASRSYILFQQSKQVIDPSLSESICWHPINKPPPSRQHRKIFGSGEFAAKLPLKAKLSQTFHFSDSGVRQLHYCTDVSAFSSEHHD